MLLSVRSAPFTRLTQCAEDRQECLSYTIQQYPLPIANGICRTGNRKGLTECMGDRQECLSHKPRAGFLRIFLLSR